MDELINEEVYLLKGIRLKAKVFLVLQVLASLCVFYLVNDSFDFVFDETRWLLILTGVVVYLLFFMALTLRIAYKKTLQTGVAKTQLTLIFILDIIPAFVLMLVTLTDIF
ncbi:MAG TPA: hypothetical protein VJ844_14250 [Mucilaginibacter sp.]|nr:hypothetical protein [Mucilaginibacter sp.]